MDWFSDWQQTQLLGSKTMLHALRVNLENFGHTTKNTSFRLVKLLADLSTRLYELNETTYLRVDQVGFFRVRIVFACALQRKIVR